MTKSRNSFFTNKKEKGLWKDFSQKDYEVFLKDSGKEAPVYLSKRIKEKMKKHIHPPKSKVVLKYSVIFLFTALFSLFLCPQKGVGFSEGNHPAFFHTLYSNKFLCGIYCGLFFFLITHISTLFFLNHYERLKVFTNLWILPHGLFAFFFGIFMVLGDDVFNFSFSYNLSWLLVILSALHLTKKIFLFRLHYRYR